MLLTLEQIPEDGRDVALDDNPSWARAAASAAVEAEVGRVWGQLHLRRTGTLVQVSGALEAEFEVPCDRCGGETRFRLGGELDLSYVPYDASSPASRELKADELDLGFYTNGALDLAAVVEEHLVLLTPPRWVCDEAPAAAPRACPALDLLSPPPAPPAGGADAPPFLDPRFAALRNLKLDN